MADEFMDDQALYSRAQNLREAKNWAAALPLLLQLLDRLGEEFEVKLHLKVLSRACDCAAELGEWAQLEALAQRMSRAFPAETEPPERLAMALRGQDREAELPLALKRMRQAMSAAVWQRGYLGAQALAKRGRIAEAAAAFAKLMERFPPENKDGNGYKAVSRFVECAIRLGTWPQMEAAARRAVLAWPEDPLPAEWLGQALAGQGRAGDTETELERLRRAEAGGPWGLAYLEIETLAAMGRLSEALDAYDRFLDAFPPQDEADERSHRALSEAVGWAETVGDQARLEDLATKLMLWFPEDPAGEAQLRKAAEAQGTEVDEISLKLKRARQAAGRRRWNGQYQLAKTLEKQRNHDEALEVYDGLLEAFVPDVDSTASLKATSNGLVRAAEREDWRRLEKFARRLLLALPEDPEALEALAKALEAQGRPDPETPDPVVLADYMSYLDRFEPTDDDVRQARAVPTAIAMAKALRAWPELERLGQRLIQSSPYDPEGYDLRAEALAGLDDPEAPKAAQRAADVRSAAGEPMLTIVTVVLEQHYGFVRRQPALIEAMNPGAPFRLLVVDNSGPAEPGLQIAHPRVEVISGVDQDLSRTEHGRGSYHHAAALNLAVRKVTTPYLLVLDPDFFVIYRNWIGEIIDHMRRRALTLFGAPWSYVWNRKWRYFPCVHFLMIDLAKAGADTLDFTPALAEDVDASKAPLQVWLKRFAPTLRSRLLLESRRDTGWLLHRRFKDIRPAVFDCAQPVIDMKTEFQTPAKLATAAGRRWDRLVPRRWRFLPADGTYVESGQAPAFHHPAIETLSPESFVWRGAPFAVHLRGVMREDLRTSASPAYKERTATAQLLEDVTGAAIWTDWAFRPGAGQGEGAEP